MQGAKGIDDLQAVLRYNLALQVRTSLRLSVAALEALLHSPSAPPSIWAAIAPLLFLDAACSVKILGQCWTLPVLPRGISPRAAMQARTLQLEKTLAFKEREVAALTLEMQMLVPR